MAMQREIQDKWESMGGADGVLGSPDGGSKKTISGGGYYQRFQRGTIYWNSVSGAFEVHGGVHIKYMELGYEVSYLGFPTSDTIDLGEWRCYNNFTGGAIYFHPLFSGQALHGPVFGKWREMGAEKSKMGYPVDDTADAPDGIGQFQRFQAGEIYWHPDTGAFEVMGRIRLKWYGLGGVNGKLGYPVSGVTTNKEGSYQKFQHGALIWHKKEKRMEVGFMD